MNFLTNGMQKNAKFYAHAISNFDFNEHDKCCMYTDIFYLISNKLLLKLRTKKNNLLHNNKYTVVQVQLNKTIYIGIWAAL